MIIETVIKIGGSLEQNSVLPELCFLLSQLGKSNRMLIVPGGGSFANAVRDIDKKSSLGNDAAHWMAILAMNRYGYLLSSLIPDSVAIETAGEADLPLSKGKTLIFLPYRLLKQEDPLPHSWDVTSDSIAAWTAGYLGAKRLILVKSRDFSPDGFFGPVSYDKINQTDIVDNMFPEVIKKNKYDLWIINGNDPEKLGRLFETGAITPDNQIR